MHGIDLQLAVHFYTDVSSYAAGLAITQFQDLPSVDSAGKNQMVEVPIIYDSFAMPPSRQKYPIYKKELYAIVTFVTKYDYLCKHPYVPAVIHTDYRLLTHFLKSDLHKEIYGHLADQMRRLNLSIEYIPCPRNKVADALFRTLFDDGCTESAVVSQVKYELEKEGPKWI